MRCLKDRLVVSGVVSAGLSYEYVVLSEKVEAAYSFA